MVLQDGGAHKLIWAMKGDAGQKCCIECRTLFAEKSGIVDQEVNDEILTCNLLFEADQDFATDAGVRGTVERLANFARTEPKTLEKREQACGFNRNAWNILLNHQLNDVVRPVSQYAHDSMHATAAHGAWNTVVFLLMTAIVAAGVDPCAHFAAYVLCWTLPTRLGSCIDHLAEGFAC